MLTREIGFYQAYQEKKKANKYLLKYFLIEKLIFETYINFVTPFVLFGIGNIFLTPKFSIDQFIILFFVLFGVMELMSLISLIIQYKYTIRELITYIPYTF